MEKLPCPLKSFRDIILIMLDFDRFLLFCLAVPVLCGMIGCQGSDDNANRGPERPVYVVTIEPIAQIVGAVVQGRGEVVRLLPPAASPHTYAPKPNDVRRVAESKALIFVAEDMDGWAARLDAPGHVALLEMVPEDLRVGCADGDGDHEHEHEHEGHHHGVWDPHFWTDPLAVKAMLPSLVKRLSELDPEGAATYEVNAAAFSKRLDGLDAEMRVILEPVKGAEVLLFHPSFLYLLRRYGLEYAGAVELSPGREATAGDLKRLSDLMKSKGIKAVFSEPQLPVRPADVVAEMGSLPVRLLDPIGGVEGRMTYEETMRYNAQTLSDALK